MEYIRMVHRFVRVRVERAPLLLLNKVNLMFT
jgi:hypothetical protein